MDNPAATLHCPNYRCQAANPPVNKFCQNCRTPLKRRYLWALGSGLEAYQLESVIANRYVLVNERILLDTKPATPPDTPQEIPPELLPYLRLSPYGLHIPQVYGRLTGSGEHPGSQIWLLEEAPIQETDAAGSQGQLFPPLSRVWKEAPAIRQLNWLWQIANLWQPLSHEGVATSLLNPNWLRPEGSILHLLELRRDAAPTLKQLGQCWSQFIPEASSPATQFLDQLCDQLIQGKIRTAEQLVGLLDQAIKDCGQWQSRRYQIFTSTDSGPVRHHNEDACYPPIGQLQNPSTDENALAIVCDGIGGHEGGEIASGLAINILREQVERLNFDRDHWNPTHLTLQLEQAACAANDAISQQNDSEYRSERQRMGTTLVMAQTSAHEIYITHVGDSRVYWVTRQGCHQITQDDDLASREVRLGYTFYRYAVRQPSSGSLIQALGMASSTTLHPTTQRFILDEDSVFLLCSDGLSDHDRVEQYWQTEILPILDGQVDVPTAAEHLIEIANRQNGHDNVTLALIYCQVTASGDTKPTELAPPQPESLPLPITSQMPTVAAIVPSQQKTQQLIRPKRRPWGLLLAIVVLLVVGAGMAYLLLPRRWIQGFVSQSSNSDPPVSVSVTPSPTARSTPTPETVSSLENLTLMQVTRSTIINSEGQDVPLLLRLKPPEENLSPIRLVPRGSVLQVIRQSSDSGEDDWLKLRVCSAGTRSADTQSVQTAIEQSANSTPESPTLSDAKERGNIYPQVQPGDRGWIKVVNIRSNFELNFNPTSEQLGVCTSEPPSEASTPALSSPKSP
ncbi:MAG: protein phosphatase 2C domain-containing protein [Coleofasciculus sp. G1-WW12-02]|uniref:PP2C family serine/threonine-protein phosphatase n=1 Tax=Coleofasciculus sp. G1-WW12-02 TaxID=3068483 RepID=UPI0032FF487A